MIRVICVCGARPNFMKIAPLLREFAASGQFEVLLVHTGQHYDENMSKLFFEDLSLPAPDVNLEVGSGSHAVQTAEIMKQFEPVVEHFGPDYVLVVGDVNSTIACGLVAVKLEIRLLHVEAGLRSFDLSMPEEVNRILTDRISDMFFVTEPVGVENLLREGVDPDRVHLVGNLMVDTLLTNRQKAATSDILVRLGVEERSYGVVTLHRPANVDNREQFGEILRAFAEIQKEIPLLFPIHPRTKKNIMQMGMQRQIEVMENLRLIDPLGYLDFLHLLDHAEVVLTDSGGIQAETTILGVPCLTLRTVTEQPVTISEGTNHILPEVTCESILDVYRSIHKKASMPALWDGKAAERIVHTILKQHEIK
ncbi:MAG: UDP-N-acetylglucosamine 2-epimerase (non-hydrolyzing) [Sedimentisphaerales bacterium]|nr:UDP-N-acetylglucosamine 2-epimerase (non-hydrolyzing) [Sedimentisphaerales bacterium]